MRFSQGAAFYRAESVFARDLSVLSTWAHGRQLGAGGAEVLELMGGTGARSVRYLEHGGARSLWTNDYSRDAAELLRCNLGAAAGGAPGGVATRLAPPFVGCEAWDVAAGAARDGRLPRGCVVSCAEATRRAHLPRGRLLRAGAPRPTAGVGYRGRSWPARESASAPPPLPTLCSQTAHVDGAAAEAVGRS